MSVFSSCFFWMIFTMIVMMMKTPITMASQMPEAMKASGDRSERMNSYLERQMMMAQNQMSQGLTATLRKMYKLSDYRAKVF